MAKRIPKDQISDLVIAERNTQRAKEKGSLAERKYKALLKEHNDLLNEVDAMVEVIGYNPVIQHINPKPKKDSSEGTPFLVLSDWHVEEKVDPRTIGGKNKYNLKIARQRSERFFQNSLKLIKEKSRDVEINDIALFILGDMITGNIHLESIENALLGPVDAIHFAQELLEAGINFLLENTPYNITIYCKVGNHSRITRRVHAATEFSNSLETALYIGMARNFAALDRVKFCIDPSYITTVKIQGIRVRYHHGHAVSYGGGVGGLHIPLRKAIKSWNETERADFDIMGHFHSFMEHTTMRYIVNGSLIGYNAYAERIKAVIEPPLQSFGLFHAKYGVTSIVPVFVE